MSDLSTNVIHTGDAFDVLPDLSENAVHAVVTDPPYGLAFMGRDWDDFEPREYQTWCENWAREVKRVLRPGGHLLAFSGNRTHHRLFAGVEDAGFDIRDTVTWHYGSGFPKALDVSKAIDKAAGEQRKQLAETLRDARDSAGYSREQLADEIGCTSSSVRDWERGRSRSEGDPVEWVVPSDEYRERLAEVLPEYPTRAERDVVDEVERGDRSGTTWKGHVYAGSLYDSEGGTYEVTESKTPAAEEWDGFKTALKPATEYVVVARAPLSEGTVAENVQTWGTGALNIDACRIENDIDEVTTTTRTSERNQNDYGEAEQSDIASASPEGRYPANVVFDETAADALDREVGELAAGHFHDGGRRDDGKGTFHAEDSYDGPGEYGEKGGPSRYFYTSKASRSERTENGKIQNDHPTVKPVDLMEWLVRLVTREGQVVLDPFAGSGTTCKAAKGLKREFVGIERNPEYADIARVRCGLTPEDPSVVRADDQQSGVEEWV